VVAPSVQASSLKSSIDRLNKEILIL